MSQQIITEDGTIIELDGEYSEGRLNMALREPSGKGAFYSTVGVELTRAEAKDLRDAIDEWLGAGA